MAEDGSEFRSQTVICPRPIGQCDPLAPQRVLQVRVREQELQQTGILTTNLFGLTLQKQMCMQQANLVLLFERAQTYLQATSPIARMQLLRKLL